MSYILDALKKSDQERQQGAGPSLQTVHRPHNNTAERGWLYLLLALVVLLILALAGLVGWFLFDLNDNSLEPAKINESAVATVITELPTNSASLNEDSKMAKVSVATASLQSVPSTKSRVVVPFSQLPLTVRNAIPAMTFSFHVYSDSPDRRTIIINGRRVKQGAMIDDQLLLDEITANGVIFSWQDHQFSIPVVEAW